MSDQNGTWRIGELAEHAGLTVRTLHHYDRIGLLCPGRQDGGQRRYTDADARRLYQIVALRGLGLPLKQIGECLTTDLDPRPLVAEQLRAVSAQIAAATELRDRLASLLDRLDQQRQPTGGDLLALLQATADLRQLVVAALSDEQLAGIVRHHQQLGREATELARDKLPALYRQALAQYRANTDPASPAVQAIVRDIDRASAALSGGDEAISRTMRRLWADHGEQAYPGSGIPWADLVAYLDAARTASDGSPP